MEVVNAKDGYDGLRPVLESTAGALTNRVAAALDRIGDPYLVRARIDPARIKTFESLHAKAHRKGWSLEEAAAKASDIVGIRVVCNNLQDVRRVADLLEQDLSAEGIAVERTDTTRKPSKAGYRAIHLEVRLPLPPSTGMETVGCEIQLRSLMQDSWARLSREDLYGIEAEAPKSLRKKMRKLSEALADLDELADEIRTELAKPKGPRVGEEQGTPSYEALALVYRSTFGEDPPDYVLQWARRELAGSDLRLDALHAGMSNAKLRKKLAAAHEKAGGATPGPSQMFRWLVRAQTRGAHAAFETAAKEAARRSSHGELKTEPASNLPSRD